MEKQEKEDSSIPFTESCRLCLRKQGIFNVFKIKGLLIDIYEIIGVRVFISENLPQMICKDCSALLSDVKYLRQVASANDKHMRSIASSALRICNENQANGQVCKENHIDVRSRDNISTEGVCIKTEITEDPQFSGGDGTSGIPQVTVVKEELQTNAVSSSDNTSFENNFPIKTEYIENSLCSGSDGDPNMSLLAIRKDLFTSSDITSCLETQITQWPQLNEIKSEQKLDQSQSSYRCEACAKNFSTWKKFYFHNRLHNKSIACPLEGCFKKFASKGDLEKHFRTHTGEKPYHCEECPRRFAQRGTLKSHREAVHKKISEVIIGT